MNHKKNISCMLFPFIMFFFAVPTWSQGKMGCKDRFPMLTCSGTVPTEDDFNQRSFESLYLTRLPEGSWLTVGDPDFSGGSIQKIEVRQSNIGRIDPGYFAKVSGPNKLRRLHFRSVSGEVVVDKKILQGLEMSLNYLQVQGGLSVNIADMAAMEALSDLELINTKIIGTVEDFERIIPRLNSLEIRDCQMDSLPWKTVAKWVSENKAASLKINGNMWNCDCSIAVLKRLGEGVVQGDLQNLRCAGPPNLAGRALVEITENELCPSTPPPPGPRPDETNEEVINGTPSGGGQMTGGSGAKPTGGDKDAGLTASGGVSAGEEAATGVRTEVIIAGTVVGALVLLFIIFIIVYKCRLYPKKKAKEERTTRTHQNKRYANVIEDPPIQKFPRNNGSQSHGGGAVV